MGKTVDPVLHPIFGKGCTYRVSLTLLRSTAFTSALAKRWSRSKGRIAYLGPHGSSLCRANYAREIAEWLSKGRLNRMMPTSGELTIAELISSFWGFVHGTTSSTVPERSARLHSVGPSSSAPALRKNAGMPVWTGRYKSRAAGDARHGNQTGTRREVQRTVASNNQQMYQPHSPHVPMSCVGRTCPGDCLSGPGDTVWPAGWAMQGT